jgi:hypothetical protein
MKSCPTCRRKYDNDMKFCLEDGSVLVADTASGITTPSSADKTLHLPGHSTEQPPAVASAIPSAKRPQSTIAARPDQVLPSPQLASEDTDVGSRRSTLPWIFAIVLVIGASGVLIAWIVTRSGATDSPAGFGEATPTPGAFSTSSPLRTWTVTPTPRTFSSPSSQYTSTPTPTPVRFSTPSAL